jgi:ABC-type nitrate/sulfonate/bicarbonate transport system permease component
VSPAPGGGDIAAEVGIPDAAVPRLALLRAARAQIASFVLPAIGFGLATAVWWYFSTRHPLTIPSPSDVVSDLRHNFVTSNYLLSHGVAGGKGYWYDLLYTTKNVAAGVALGTAIGVGIGLVSVPIPVISEVVNPIAATFGAAPIFIAAPFFLIWFGIVPTAQILMVSFYTALLMYIFSRRASENVPAELVESASTLGARGSKIFWLIYVPATVPELIGGFRIALAGAWGLEAIAELLGAQQGTGFLINFFAQAFLLTGILSITLILGLVAIVCDGIAVAGARLLVRWSAAGEVV